MGTGSRLGKVRLSQDIDVFSLKAQGQNLIGSILDYLLDF